MLSLDYRASKENFLFMIDPHGEKCALSPISFHATGHPWSVWIVSHQPENSEAPYSACHLILSYHYTNPVIAKTVTGLSLEDVRRQLPSNFIRRDRTPLDAPEVLEVWLKEEEEQAYA